MKKFRSYEEGELEKFPLLLRGDKGVFVSGQCARKRGEHPLPPLTKRGKWSSFPSYKEEEMRKFRSYEEGERWFQNMRCSSVKYPYLLLLKYYL
ncbi:hypothetical protein LLG34_03875 [bacterium]|nr:hypothetical protein [bacterium]